MIHTISYKSTKYYIIDTCDGLLAFDVGWPNTFSDYREAVKQSGLNFKEIKYFIVSHFHIDHAGLAGMLQKNRLNFYFFENQIEYIDEMEELIQRKYSSYCKIDRSQITQIKLAESRNFLMSLGLDGEIIQIYGHGSQSIVLLFDNGEALIGDLPVLEDYDELVKNDWIKLKSKNAKVLFHLMQKSLKFNGEIFIEYMQHKEVFDYWKNKLKDFELLGNIKSGKEADVFKVFVKGEIFALKIYKDRSILSTRAEYTQGKWIREKSLRKAVSKKTRVGKDLLSKLWTKREFYMLQKLHEAGANVPKVYDFNDKSILMQYLGDESLPAPRLIDTQLSKKEYQFALEQITKSINIFYENGIVHGDLSEYNILWFENKPWIIDFPQAIDVRKNENAQEFLERDKRNILKYFEELLI